MSWWTSGWLINIAGTNISSASPIAIPIRSTLRSLRLNASPMR